MNKYKVALFLCAFVWGFGYVAMDHLINRTNTELAITIRFISAGLLIYIFRYKNIKGQMKANMVPMTILGIVLFFAFLFQTNGLALTTTSKNAFLTATNVIWTPVLVSLIYKYKVSRNVKIGSVLMIVGIALVSLDGLSKFNIGDVYTLIGAVFFAIHIILINKFATKDNVDTLVFGQLFITGILALGVTASVGTFAVDFGPDFLISVIFVVVFSTALCFFLQNYGLSQVDSSSGALILSLESMFGVIAAIAIDGEPINTITVIGFIVMFGAILVAERKEV